jgi:5-methylcytosine-specific restriction endonuclease McrA
MPRGIYVRTKEMKEHMSKARKGKHNPKLSEAKKGHIVSRETRLKLSKAHKGRMGKNSSNWKGGKVKRFCKECGKEFYVFSSKVENGGGKFCSRKCMRKWQNKNDITPIIKIIRTSLKYDKWRKAIFERDNFTCQVCGQHGGDLQVHHINNFAEFSELRFAINNGITLCKKCHREFHKKYGKKNNTKEQLEEFLFKEA